MSIQLEINNVNERSRNMELGLVLIAALAAMFLIITGDFAWAFVVIGAYIPLSIALSIWLRAWRESRILELYRYQALPILEIQRHENDSQNFKRAEAHREMLLRSGNEIYARGIIHVEEIYYNDALFGIAETPEEQAIRRADYIKQYLNDWGLRQSKDNNRFLKQWVYGQDMGEETPPVAETTPSVFDAETGDFWTKQFPLFTRLVRGNGGGKEVETT